MSKIRLAMLFSAMAMVGTEMQRRIRIMRSEAGSGNRPTSSVIPHQGKREIARRKRQIEARKLRVAK